MRKFIGLLLIVGILVGCQNSEVKVEKEVKPEVDNRSVYESNKKPRYIHLGFDELDMGLDAHLIQYCWNEDLNACPLELTEKTKEELLEGKNYPYRSYSYPPNKPIDFFVELDVLVPESVLPFPDTIELYYFEDEQLVPVTITNDSSTHSFTLPDKEGIHTFLFRTIYDSDIKGTAFYAFRLRLQN